MQAIKVTETGLVHTGHVSVESVELIPGSANATVVLNDSLDGTGSDKGGVKTETAYSNGAYMACTMFATGIYVTLTGTGAVAYIYIE